MWDGREAKIYREICHLLLGLSKKIVVVLYVGQPLLPGSRSFQDTWGQLWLCHLSFSLICLTDIPLTSLPSVW